MGNTINLEIELTVTNSHGNTFKRLLYRGQDEKVLEAIEKAIQKALRP